jgi:DNA helicase-4
LRDKAQKYVNWNRYHAFLEIFEPLFEDYQSSLIDSGQIDFNDMIIQATELVKKGDFKSKYKYILVDEFQDISKSRYKFLRSLLDQGKDHSLFCVGDDWQSVYRFTGSDLSIMTGFDRHFGFNEVLFLDETFRYNSSINDFSSNFIMKNQSQYPKEIKAKNVDYPAISIIWYDDLNLAIRKTLEQIESIDENPEVLILGRYNINLYKDLDSTIFEAFSKQTQRTFDNLSSTSINGRFLTIHRSKGEEADYVVLIGLRAGTYGFPCEIEDDPVLRLVLSDEDQFPNAEERRLFYVAVTRAKKGVFLLADRSSISSFIDESLEDIDNVIEDGKKPIIQLCPSCGKGFINKNPDEFENKYACSRKSCNYQPITCPQCKMGFLYIGTEDDSTYFCRDCSFQARICPECREGYLKIHEKEGRFWGCSNYRRNECRYTESIPL